MSRVHRLFVPRGWSAARALAVGTAAVGVLDGLDALVFFGLRGGSPLRVFQAVASGVLGRAAFAGGVATFLLGVALHFVVAGAIVGVYLLASRRLAGLLRRPVLCGLAYGLVAYYGMRLLVVPLSAAPAGGSPAWPVVVNGWLAHLFLVGLPSSFVATAVGTASAAAVSKSPPLARR